MKARKRFGQNFLIDKDLVDAILAVINPIPSDKIIEIGAGRGALTHSLFHSGCDLTLIELDRDLIPNLLSKFVKKAPERCRLLNQDVLAVDFGQFNEPLRIVGNLPYNISTPVLFKLLDDGRRFKDIHVMLQKEVADRILAPPYESAYGRLSIMIQASARVDSLINVSPQCFSPTPKVDSTLIRICPCAQRMELVKSMTALQLVVKTAFAQRRKTLKNNFRKLISIRELDSNGINPQDRAETLSVENYVNLANFIALRDGI